MPPGARRLIGQTAHLRHQKAVSSIEAPGPIKAAQPPKSCNRKRPCLRFAQAASQQRAVGLGVGPRPANRQHLL